MWWVFLFLCLNNCSSLTAIPQPGLGRILLPIEVLGEDGTTVDQVVYVSREQRESAKVLWLQVHGIRYPEQASIQINESAWIRLSNETVTIAEPGKSFGGIGGGFSTLQLTLPLEASALVAGANVIHFRFNKSDGLASGYRVLGFNFLTGDGSKILQPADFEEDAPESWKPPFSDEASIRRGKELWLNAPLVASSRPHSAQIQARCADCHAHDGRDLKYFNFSNASIVSRSRFHGLTIEQGELIASYIRSLPYSNPGRPWNPPYQPGPGIDEKPVSQWAAGSGLAWVLNNDADGLPYLLDTHRQQSGSGDAGSQIRPDLRTLLNQISPDVFHPDGNLNAREIPIALQLPDWSQWLPRIHPKDAWGTAFLCSDFAAMYDGEPSPENKNRRKTALRTLLAETQNSDEKRSVASAFDRWSHARRVFVGQYVNSKTVWSLELTDRVYSTQLWQLAKTWEMTQEFGLEAQDARVVGRDSDLRVWRNTIPAETAPDAVRIPNGPTGVGGTALNNEYLSASWYELQIILNSGNHRHFDRTPIDWVYLIGHFHDLYSQSQQPEPVRLLIAVTKAFQSTDPQRGPGDLSRGWRPDQGVDPRIMISAKWQPIFKPFPMEVRRALTESMLSAWLDKNLQYPITEYLPLPPLQHDYKPRESYSDISGGGVWNAAEKFRAAGVSDDVANRLHNWGVTYTDRAARIQYH